MSSEFRLTAAKVRAGLAVAGTQKEFESSTLSENRSLAVLEILVHLSASLPDRYVLGAAGIPDDLAVDILDESQLPGNWSTLDPREQESTRRVRDGWVAQQRSEILSVPSVILGERNYVLNPAHPDF